MREKNLYANENDVQLKNILDQYDTKNDQGYSNIAYKLFCEENFPETETNDLSNFGDKRYVILAQRLEWAEKEIQIVQSSASYRIGCRITWIPRKICRGIRCYRENGLHYTLHRIKQKIFTLTGKGTS